MPMDELHFHRTRIASALLTAAAAILALLCLHQVWTDAPARKLSVVAGSMGMALVVAGGYRPGRDARPAVYFGLFLAGTFFAAFLTRALIFAHTYDTWMHLALIRRTLEGGLFPGDPYYPGHSTLPHYSIVHILYGAVAHLARIRPHQIWEYASGPLVVIYALFFYRWAAELTGNRRAAFLAAVFKIGSGAIAWHYATYPYRVALVFYVITLFFYFRGLRNPARKAVWLAGISAGICLLVHLFIGICCLISIVSYGLVQTLYDRWVARERGTVSGLFSFLPVGLLVASPWLFVNGYERIVRRSVESAAYTVMPGHEQRFFTMGEWVLRSFRIEYFLQPYHGLLWAAAAIGLLGCIAAALRRSAQDRHLFLVANAAVPTVLLITPLYMLAAEAFSASVIPRFMVMFPVSILAALAIDGLLQKAGEYLPRSLPGKMLRFVFLFLFLFLFFLPVFRTQFRVHDLTNRVPMPHTWEQAAQELETHINGKVVLSDTWTSYFLPYWTGAYVAAVPGGHGSPYIDHASRKTDVDRVLNPATPLSAVREICETYGADYILVNLRYRPDRSFHPFSQRSATDPADRVAPWNIRFGRKPVYRGGGFLLYDIRK